MSGILTSQVLLDELIANKVDFFTGVPDSIISKLIILIDEQGHSYVPATCEDVAVGIAVGSYLAGKRPCVLMQDSGLGNSSDAFMTLAKLYKIPLLYVITIPTLPPDAGVEEQPNYIHHLDWERLALPTLDALEFPYVLIDKDSGGKEVEKAITLMGEKQHPVALIIRKGYLDEKR
jgi:sulfopyruvate decarboxylase TPP-binding subunit